jgi:hypothetical protein
MSGHVAGAWILRQSVPQSLDRRRPRARRASQPDPADPEGATRPARRRPAHRAPPRESVVGAVVRAVVAPVLRRRARA